MRQKWIRTIPLAALLAISSCGKQEKDGASTQVIPRAPIGDLPISRVAVGLDTIAGARSNSELQLGAVSPEKLEQSLDSLAKAIVPTDESLRSFKLRDDLGSRLNDNQKLGAANLVAGLQNRLQDGTITKIQVGADGGLIVNGGVTEGATIKDPVIRPHPRPNIPVISGTELSSSSFRDGSVVLLPQHAGEGSALVKWSWKWWGIKVSFTHRATYYLCSYTDWVLNQLPLPGWIEWLIKQVACYFHNHDGDGNGIGINISWAGAYWFSNGY